MSRSYNREYEAELIDKLTEYGCDADDVLNHFLDWLNVDQTCGALEDYCIDNDIELPE